MLTELRSHLASCHVAKSKHILSKSSNKKVNRIEGTEKEALESKKKNPRIRLTPDGNLVQGKGKIIENEDAWEPLSEQKTKEERKNQEEETSRWISWPSPR